MEETIKYKTIPYDSLIDIKVSGTFYRKLVELLSALSETVPLDEFKEVLEKLKGNDNPKTLFELNVHCLISLIYELETKAVEQNKTKEMEIDAKTGKPVTES
jgi:hypothetical protein